MESRSEASDDSDGEEILTENDLLKKILHCIWKKPFECLENIREDFPNAIRKTITSSGGHGALVFEAASLGLDDVILFLINQGADLNEAGPQTIAENPSNYLHAFTGTPLEVACRNGHASTAQCLINSGASLIPGVSQSILNDTLIKTTPEESADVSIVSGLFHPSSVFTTTLMNGHVNVLDVLIREVPAVLRCSAVRGRLFYTACLGGHLKMVKKCVYPDIDVNSPVQLVLPGEESVCQELTPLYAACRGHYMPVISFLVMDIGALITSPISTRFEEVIDEFLINFCVFPPQPVDETQTADPEHAQTLEQPKQCYMMWQRKGLSMVTSSWVEGYLNTVVEINIGGNDLTCLPKELPWSMTSLKKLDASHNRLNFLEKVSIEEIQCTKLSELDLNHNHLLEVPIALFQIKSLNKLCVSHNKLSSISVDAAEAMLYQARTVAPKRDSVMLLKWSCQQLHLLDISYNFIELLPCQLQTATGLRKFYASHNSLKKFISPWRCKLETLDLSNNILSQFPASVEEYWSNCLKILNLEDNQLDEIREGICKLKCLVDLNLSNNLLQTLPKAELWETLHLESLNLSDNQLSNLKNPTDERPTIFSFNFFKRKTVFYDGDELIEFGPGLTQCLRFLDLKNNNLNHVPLSIPKLEVLEILDIRGNPNITSLPLELGCMTDVWKLRVDNNQLSNVPKSIMRKDSEPWVFSKEILAYLRSELRRSQEYYKMKMVVVGKENRGKTSLIARLQGKELPPNIATNGVKVTHWVIRGREVKKFTSRKTDSKNSTFNYPDIEFSVWDMAGQQDFYVTHQCFLTTNALYVVLWDVTLQRNGVEQLKPWLLNIQSRAPDSTVIVVGTHVDLLTSKESLEGLRNLIVSMYNRHGYPKISHITEVSCIDNMGISDLKRMIYQQAINMKDMFKARQFLIGRKVPRSYIELEELVKQKALAIKNQVPLKSPVLLQEDLTALAQENQQNDINTPEELSLAARFLHESGALLHYPDQLRGLDNLYFIDPTWLCDLLAKIITVRNVHGAAIRDGILFITDAKLLFSEDRFQIQSQEQLNQYIQLMEKFNIAFLIDDKRLLIPSKLPVDRPGADLTPCMDEDQSIEKRMVRLYKLGYVPSGLWSRLITRILINLDRISDLSRQQNPQRSSLMRNTSWSAKCGIRRHSDNGFRLFSRRKIYWREGILVTHNDGFFLVESTYTQGVLGSDVTETQGILITVQSLREDFSAMGFIIDQIDSLISEWFPGLEGFDENYKPLVERLIPCPHCIAGQRSMTDIQWDQVNCFTLEVCGLAAISQAPLLCPAHEENPQTADKLTPDLVLADIPVKYRLDPDDLRFELTKGNQLGVGGAGSVYKGQYGDVDVAVKVLHSGTKAAFNRYSTDDSGTGTMESKQSVTDKTQQQHRHFTATSVAANGCRSNAALDIIMHGGTVVKTIYEMRQEVTLLSRLQHPCIVSLIGMSMRPFCFAIEFAQHGSLKSILQEEVEKLDEKAKIHGTLMNHFITWKILVQVVNALTYLHSNSIIYRDLKSDNVLIFSLDATSPINAKISDYGISTLNMPHGVVGNEGTAGYQAPEVKSGSAYDEKVDIFSLAMLIYEMITGQRPYHDYKSSSKITQAVRKGERPNVKEFVDDIDFAYLESLMTECWNGNPYKRKSAKDVTRSMETVQFYCLQRMLPKHSDTPLPKVYCMFTPKQGDRGRTTQTRYLTWMWSGVGSQRVYHVVDAKRGVFRYRNKPAPGSRVTCMERAGQHIWVGNEGSSIEVFGYGSMTGKSELKCLETIQITDIPLCMLYHNRQSQGVPDCMYAGTCNGSLVVFQVDNTTNKLFKTLIIQPKASCESLVLTCDNDYEELWVSSGKEIAIVDLSVNMVEERIDLTKFELVIEGAIKQLYSSERRVWCVCHNAARVLEIDANTRQIVKILSCHSVNPLNDNIMEVYGDDKKVKSHIDSKSHYFDFDIEKALKEQSRSLSPESSLYSRPRNRNSLLIPPRSPRLQNKGLTDVTDESKTTSLPRDFKAMQKRLPKFQRLSRTDMEMFYDVAGVLLVDDTLWISRKGGSILLVNVSGNSPYGYEDGQVIACLVSCDRAYPDDYSLEQSVFLEASGSDRILSLRRMIRKTAEGFDLIPGGAADQVSQLDVWEAYGAKRVNECVKSWQAISEENYKVCKDAHKSKEIYNNLPE